MSFLGLGHIRHYTDDEWPAVKAALANAGIDAKTGALFTATQSAIAHLLQNDPLVALAEKAISDVSASGVPITQRLATAAEDVIPGLIAYLSSGGVTKTADEVRTLATTFTQEVFNLKSSSSIAGAVAAVEAVVSKVA
jgi:methylmalonyl-CoA mutase cobalamin-binding subunit